MSKRTMAELVDAATTTTQTDAWIPEDTYSATVYMALHADLLLPKIAAAETHKIGRGRGDSVQIRVWPSRTAQGPISEGTALTRTQSGTATTVTVTIEKYGDYDQITDEALTFTSDDVKSRVLVEMGAALYEKLEQVVVDLLEGSITNGRTSVLASMGIIDFQEILLAKAELRKQKMKPDFVMVGPDHEVDILLDSNLTKTVNYEKGTVTFAGEIGRIGNIRVIVHELAAAKDTSTVDAVQGVMFDSSRAFAVAWGKPLRHHEQYVPEEDVWKHVCWAWFGASIVDGAAICQLVNAAA